MRHTPHPDDREALESLIDQFTAHRRSRGVSDRVIARALGVGMAALWYLENRRPANPLVATLQAYGEVAGLVLLIDLEDLPDVTPSPAVVSLRAAGYLGTASIAYLRQAREALGWSRNRIQAEQGWKWSSLAGLENRDAEPLVSSVQRYARCLGGRAIPRWEVQP